MALRSPFPSRQAQYVQVFLLKPAPSCTLFAGLGSTNKSAISLLFFYYLTVALSSPLCPLLRLFSYLKFSGRCGRNCLLAPSALSGYNGSPDTRFSPGTTPGTTRDELARRGVLFVPSAIPCSLSPFLFCIHSCLFSDWSVLSHQNFLTNRFP